jgi:signal transduction histidine kinase
LIRFKDLLQFEQQILASTLVAYHANIWLPSASVFHFPLSFILYGLFLLWQPLWNKESSIKKLPTVVIALAFFLISYFFHDESLVFFGLILSGLIGSRLLSQSSFRAFDLLALLIIILEMVVGVVPGAFPQIELPRLFADYMQPIILIPILLFYLAPNYSEKKRDVSQIDLMHGLLTSTLIFIVLLGGMVINLLYGVDYIDGLLLSVFVVSTLTIGISWFWNPGVGFSGIGVLLDRYTMTIGGPFETWINTLTTLIEEHYLTPSEYLEAACEHLVENDWLNAIQWNLKSYRVSVGEKTGSRIDYKLSEKVEVQVYFKSYPGAALEQHTILLIRMAYQFYLSKLNQEKVRTHEHFSTIHHTGARLTHDVKNILQSIKTSLNILNMNQDSQKHQKLLRSNLTQISKRLENTLNRLKAPDLDTRLKLIDCNHWMTKLEVDHQSNPRIVIHSDIENNIPIPIDLFDSVIENLINNALRKPSAEHIDVRLLCDSEILLLSVCDDGVAVDESVEDNLFKQPVSSGTGMGIGLYQAAIMAHSFGFELVLSQNEAGKVCFNLFQHRAN